MSGEQFSTIHGDLMTEVTINRDAKVRGGSMMGGYSTSDKTNDAFVKKSHVMAKSRSKLTEQVHLHSSCVHQELSPGSRKYNDNIVTDMKEKVLDYCNPFLNTSARHLKTGVETDVNIVSDLLSSTEIGNGMFTEFAEEKMKAPEEKRIDFFASIPKSKIRNGLEKVKVKNNTLDMIKEDRQAFGLLMGDFQTPSKALKYPLTIVSLTLAEPDETLRQQSTKATMRRFLYKKSDAIYNQTPEEADWLVDGMAAVAAVTPQETYKDFADATLSYCKPKDVACPKSLTIIFDSYNSTSIKHSTQIKRGQSGRRVYITSMMQKMPTRDDWDKFLNNGGNKSELAKAITDYYYKPKSIREKLEYPLVVAHEEKTWKITNNQVYDDLSYNHIEADTTLILEASISKHPVVIRAFDTGVTLINSYLQSMIG